MAKSKLMWATDRTWYTIVHRKKNERKCYGFGYRTDNLPMLREIAEKEAAEGEYRCVKIINATTNKDHEYFTKARR